MDIHHDHVVHSRNGVLGDGVTSLIDAERIAEQAYRTTLAGGIVWHTHGGLVDRQTATAIATRLSDTYESAGTYPIFSVWESGFYETIRNNLQDVLQDKVFRELFKKVSEWVLKKGSSSIATKGFGGSVAERQLRSDLDDWFDGKSSINPFINESPPADTVPRDLGFDQIELSSAIASELEMDDSFQATIAGLAITTNRVTLDKARSLGVEPVAVNCKIDKQALDDLLAENPQSTRGGISWLSVATFIAKVVIAVLRRYQQDKDHGAYTTIVEEVLRAAYLDRAGIFIWNQMKRDASIDSFNNPGGAGEHILQTWRKLADSGEIPPKITLVAHSTGAIFVNALIARSAELLPHLTYDVIMLAPACTSFDFATMYTAHSSKINRFRIFGMSDELERKDQLIPIIYPRSLLYFVCGVVESEVDIPLLGMQRHLSISLNDNAPYLTNIREILSDQGNAVWSVSETNDGHRSGSVSHGDFDNDATTLASVVHIISSGF
ncbi:hypothetical protein [Pigmentiphaga litoralis]|uniref:hypothetical protein n=1 Tax=Pigmentiphaga litoralis TaxID=516702 RepID=UPI003B42B029